MRCPVLQQAHNVPVLVLNAMSKAHGWDPALDWSEAALREAVGHAQLRVRAVPQQGGVVRADDAARKIDLEVSF